MNSTPNDASNEPVGYLSNPFIAVSVPAIATAVLFVFAAVASGSAFDREIIWLARFLSLLILALGIYTARTVGRRGAYSHLRWLTGQTAAASFGLAAGFVWSASAFGAGFFFFIIGAALLALVISQELQMRTNRRLVRQRSARESVD